MQLTDKDLLYRACSDDNIILLKELIKTDENVNIQTISENTLLHIAVWYGSINCVKELLQAGSNVNAINNSGESPLHYACSSIYSIHSIPHLLIAGANPNIQNQAKLTPLYYICKTLKPRRDLLHKNSTYIKDLLLAGGDLTIRNICGDTPNVPQDVLQEIGDLETSHRKWIESLSPDCGAVKNYLKKIPGRQIKAARH